MSISQLKKILPPPESPTEVPTRPAWKKIEKEVGVRLPNDYKEYVQAYGTGTICEFLIISNPFSSQEGFALISTLELAIQTLSQLKKTEGDDQVPFDIHPTRPGLLAFGGDENGNGLYWLTDGEPDSWPCVIGQGRGKKWEQYDITMAEFLCQVISKEIRSAIWPKTFPKKGCQFRSC